MNYSDFFLALLVALLVAFLFGIFKARQAHDLFWFIGWAVIGTILGEGVALLSNQHWLPIGQLYLLPAIAGALTVLFAGQWWRHGRSKKRKKTTARSNNAR